MNHHLPLQKFSTLLVLFSVLSGFVRAQEAVPLEEAQNIARKLTAAVIVVNDLPFAVEADAERPVALKGGDAGVLLLPDKHLTADVVAGADKTFVPVAQLWAYKIALVAGGSGFASDKLRSVTLGEGDKSRTVQLFFLGVAKNSQGNLELAIFGKGNEPLHRVALQKAGSGPQGLPIGVSGEKTGEESARLTLSLVGGYTVNLDVIKGE